MKEVFFTKKCSLVIIFTKKNRETHGPITTLSLSLSLYIYIYIIKAKIEKKNTIRF